MKSKRRPQGCDIHQHILKSHVSFAIMVSQLILGVAFDKLETLQQLIKQKLLVPDLHL